MYYLFIYKDFQQNLKLKERYEWNKNDFLDNFIFQLFEYLLCFIYSYKFRKYQLCKEKNI